MLNLIRKSKTAKGLVGIIAPLVLASGIYFSNPRNSYANPVSDFVMEEIIDPIIDSVVQDLTGGKHKTYQDAIKEINPEKEQNKEPCGILYLKDGTIIKNVRYKDKEFTFIKDGQKLKIAKEKVLVIDFSKEKNKDILYLRDGSTIKNVQYQPKNLEVRSYSLGDMEIDQDKISTLIFGKITKPKEEKTKEEKVDRALINPTYNLTQLAKERGTPTQKVWDVSNLKDSHGTYKFDSKYYPRTGTFEIWIKTDSNFTPLRHKDIVLFQDEVIDSKYSLVDKTKDEKIWLNKDEADVVAYDIIKWLHKDVKLITEERITKEIEKRGKKLSDFDGDGLGALRFILDVYSQPIHTVWKCGSKSDSNITYEIEWHSEGRDDSVSLTVKRDGKRRFSILSSYLPAYKSTRDYVYTGEYSSSSRGISEQDANTALRDALKDMKK